MKGKRLLVVLDYSNSSVHFYHVEEDVVIDEEYIGRLGHNPNSSEWMYDNDINIIWHNGINGK